MMMMMMMNLQKFVWSNTLYGFLVLPRFPLNLWVIRWSRFSMPLFMAYVAVLFTIKK
jgi:hypothetical protein